MPDRPTGTLTLLFTDMEGSTHLLQQLGKRYGSVLAECRRMLRTAFAQYNGYEIDTQGDAFFVVFARAIDAVGAAVTAQRVLASTSWPEGAMVRVRMGLHTGEPEPSPEGYVGLDVHLAARIMSAGHGGQVLLSQTASDIVKHDLPDGVSLLNMGKHHLKDLHQPIRIFQLVISGLSCNFPPLKTLDISLNNLPVQPTPFMGREQEVTAIEHLLRREDVRLLTLTGAGGTGKSRLALEVAAKLRNGFADGVFFVNLAPISDSGLVVPTIAQALELKETGDSSLLDLLKSSLRKKKLLLLLDNFEQVVHAAPSLADLLTACPKLKILVTSRIVLHMQAEHEFAVPPLALPDLTCLPDLSAVSQYEAVAFFISRAQAVKPSFQLTHANALAVAEICARLDGLPLAIELAAARMKLLTPQALLSRLSQRLQVLTSTTRDTPARQQTLRNTIAWSYNLLDAYEQQLFRRLSVFVGGCTLEAAEAVCAEPGNEGGQVLDGVASLTDKSMLQQTEVGEEPRLVMLETIREYGLECLAAGGETEASRQAHAVYYLALVEETEPKLLGPEQVVWFERLEREHDNLRTAMRWLLERGGDRHSVEMALRLVSALQRFWQMSGHFSEGRNFLERALSIGASFANTQIAASARAKALAVAADLALFDLYDANQAEGLCRESLTLYRTLGDKQGIATSLSLLGWVAQRRFNREEACALHEEGLALSRELGDKRGIAEALYDLSYLAFSQGDYDKAYALKEESLALFRELGDTWSIAYLLLQVVSVASYQGNYDKACPAAEEGLALFRELGDKEGIADALHSLGGVILNQGNYARARVVLEEGLALYRDLGLKRGIARVLFSLGRVAFSQGDYAKAEALHQEDLHLFKELDDKWLIALSLEELGAVVAMQGKPRWAARLVGAAAALREAIGSIPLPAERTNYERGIAFARTQLGEDAFVAALAEGRAMTPEQVLAAQE
ncbi:MAG TPA: tetratricopeptide repeat protein [Ktedonobacteraceae bacterium]|nr:tetratricopeptide repeat protein [Ktedonobacteraceae bacterium]